MSKKKLDMLTWTPILWRLFTDTLKRDSTPSRASHGSNKVHERLYEKNNSLETLKDETPRPTPELTARTLTSGNSKHSHSDYTYA